MQKPPQTEKIGQPISWIFWLVVICIVLLWAFSPFLVSKYLDTKSGTQINLSDTFAPLNVLFSGLAFACFAYTVYMQRAELALTREELRLQRVEAAATRVEIQGQREQAERQNLLMATQADQNLFMSLLTQHNELVDRLSVSTSSLSSHISYPLAQFTGRKCFEMLFELFNHRYRTLTKANGKFDKLVATETLEGVDLFENEFCSYFMSLRGLLSFAGSPNLFPNIRYAHIVRDQFSPHELSILFYFTGLTTRTTALKSLLEQYGMLVGIQETLLISCEPHRDLLNSSAFTE